jgi:hypothetical protein
MGKYTPGVLDDVRPTNESTSATNVFWRQIRNFVSSPNVECLQHGSRLQAAVLSDRFC